MLHKYPTIFINWTAMYIILSNNNHFSANFEKSQSLPFLMNMSMSLIIYNIVYTRKRPITAKPYKLGENLVT